MLTTSFRQKTEIARWKYCCKKMYSHWHVPSLGGTLSLILDPIPYRTGYRTFTGTFTGTGRSVQILQNPDTMQWFGETNKKQNRHIYQPKACSSSRRQQICCQLSKQLSFARDSTYPVLVPVISLHNIVSYRIPTQCSDFASLRSQRTSNQSSSPPGLLDAVLNIEGHRPGIWW